MMETRTAPPGGRGLGRRLRILAVGRNPRRTLVRAAILAAVCLVVFKLMLWPMRVTGLSMTPAYADHSFNFVNRLAYLWHEPRRGDVVSIRLTPSQGWLPPGVLYMKRIIGLPGETISFVNGRVLVDGRPLNEPYEKGPCDWNLSPVRVDTGKYFVVGDNRSMPPADHVFGQVERSRIAGKALL
jgi:signal peptidase I